MNRQEVNKAYPALKREWPGRVLRIHMPHHPGIPDFQLLYNRHVLFAEVKWLPDKARAKQLQFLNELHDEGYNTCILGKDDEGWTMWRGAYLDLIGVVLKSENGQFWSKQLNDPTLLHLLLLGS